MKSVNYKVKVGIIGCGAIGSRMAKSICTDLANDCKVSGLYDINREKVKSLEKELKLKNKVRSSVKTLIKHSDCVVEAINGINTIEIIKEAIKAQKSVLAMSVGRVLNNEHLFQLARKNKAYILLPSGAIAGIDAIKAASLVPIKKITLTTRKHPKGFIQNDYFNKKGIILSKIKKETIVFQGSVDRAVKLFPQNINVAATLALATQSKEKIKILIIASPTFKKNSHEIEIIGDFGRITTKTENLVCPDNPKTSYLAVLSGVQTLKQYCTGILIGT